MVTFSESFHAHTNPKPNLKKVGFCIQPSPSGTASVTMPTDTINIISKNRMTITVLLPKAEVQQILCNTM